MNPAARAAAAVVALLTALAAHPLPAGASDDAPVTSRHSISMDGWDRPYLLTVPPDREGPRPLIVALHGGLNGPEHIRRQSGLDEAARAAGYAVAYPEGLLGTWNAGLCCWFARWAGVDDVAFLDRLIDTLAAQGLADPRRVFVTGFSNGGGLAYRYACERSARVTAIAVVSGALAVRCRPDRPTSVLTFHGTSDPSVPYEGGGNMDAGVDVPFLPVRLTMEYWRRLNRLPPLRSPLPGAPDDCVGTGPGPLVVALCTQERGGHEWPPYATDLMTGFFTARPSLPLTGKPAPTVE